MRFSGKTIFSARFASEINAIMRSNRLPLVCSTAVNFSFKSFWTIHILDFSEEYLKHRDIPRTTKPIIALETLVKTAAGATLGSAALYGFKKLSERKRIGEARGMIETLLADDVQRQQHFLAGLQLDMSSKNVNDVLRQKTLQELIHESRSKPELKPAPVKLKLLIDEKNQKKLQKALTGERENQGE